MKTAIYSKWKSTPVGTVLKLYLLSIGFFSIFRIILFFTQTNRVNCAQEFHNVLLAFFMGIRYDIVISGYIFLVPVFILFLLDILRIQSKIVFRIIFIFISLLFAIFFLICAADIPYFNQFFSRFSIMAFEWLDSPAFVFNMIVQEPKYFLYGLLALVLIFLFTGLLLKILRQNNKISNLNLFVKIGVYLVVLGTMFLGIRGRITEKSPIRVGTAYFCDNSFLNQLGLNPVFTFMRSYLDSKSSDNKRITLMDSDEAIKNVHTYLSIDTQTYNSPIARVIRPDTSVLNKPNVVIIIMEAMSAAKMKRHGHPKKLTPFLDSLSEQSIYHENIYTAGKHTFNGIFSTLFSFPALYRQHPMKQMRKYNGISSSLKQHGYQTIYFTTHDGQFDNVEGFLINNEFDKVVKQADYPSEEIKTTLGVPDDYMFRFSLPILNEMAAKKMPFLSVFMTASDHGPIYIPPYFTASVDKLTEQVIQYADWSLRTFIDSVRKQAWFDNTVFVFVADHGSPLKADYDISLDYHHTPLLFYAPLLFDTNVVREEIGGQIDVFPTLMGMLNLSYVNNSLGIDLWNESRPYIIINDDDKIGVLDNDFLVIMKPKEKSKLYKYRTRDKTDYATDYPDKVAEMELYAMSNMQVYQEMLNNNQTFVEPD